MVDLAVFWKSVLEQDEAAIVLCNLLHEIVYMNPVAVRRYANHGGSQLLGKNILDCHNKASREKMLAVCRWFQESPSHNKVFTTHNAKENSDVYMVALRSDDGTLIGYYERHMDRTPETQKCYTMESV